MRLLSAHIVNFKLMKDVRIDFSTDSSLPLTVIRAENGNGKTTLLHALSWALYGNEGLPADAAGKRLIDSSSPLGSTVDVQVTLEFDERDALGLTRYRLIRTQSQTLTGPEATDVQAGANNVRLYRIEDGVGEKEVDFAFVRKLFPLRLLRVFFTDGENVETFIAGAGGKGAQQKEVHDAINAILGLDELRKTALDSKEVVKQLRREVSSKSGEEAKAAEIALGDAELNQEMAHANLDRAETELALISKNKEKWEKELNEIRGKGDLDQIQADLETANEDLGNLKNDRETVLKNFRSLFESESFSWAIGGETFDVGLSLLKELADRDIIPGVSIEVLKDRLDSGICICGEALTESDASSVHRRLHVQGVIESNSQRSRESQLLTELWHKARSLRDNEDARIGQGKDFWVARSEFQSQFVQKRNEIEAKNAVVVSLEERRSAIDEARLQTLIEKIARVQPKIIEESSTVGGLREIARESDDRCSQAQKHYETFKGQESKSDRAALELAIATDISQMLSESLIVMETAYVKEVGQQTSKRFLKIVGSDPVFEGAVFTGVEITSAFDIKVLAGKSSLDPAFELNGASQRALTLAFIWSLMDVAGVQLPRIIDTPLGMVAGGVRTRMVEEITEPGDADSSQTILLLTRAEIRDIEDLLDLRSGQYATLTLSSAAVQDLVYPRARTKTEIEVCNCTHRFSCEICARKYDSQHGVVFREVVKS